MLAWELMETAYRGMRRIEDSATNCRRREAVKVHPVQSTGFQASPRAKLTDMKGIAFSAQRPHIDEITIR